LAIYLQLTAIQKSIRDCYETKIKDSKFEEIKKYDPYKINPVHQLHVETKRMFDRKKTTLFVHKMCFDRILIGISDQNELLHIDGRETN